MFDAVGCVTLSGMSIRTAAPFGSLVDSVKRSPAAKPRTPWRLVDAALPGVVASWTKVQGEWQALVCYVSEGELRTGMLPARRLTPR